MDSVTALSNLSNMLAAAAAANGDQNMSSGGGGFDLAALLFKSAAASITSAATSGTPQQHTSTSSVSSAISKSNSSPILAPASATTAFSVSAPTLTTAAPSSTATSPHSVDSAATTTTGGTNSPPASSSTGNTPVHHQPEITFRGRGNTSGIPLQYLTAPPPITRDNSEKLPFTPIRPTYAPSGHGRQILIYDSRAHPGHRREFAYKTRFTNQSGLTTVYFRCMACRALRHRLQRYWPKEKLPAVPCIAVKNELLMNDPDWPEASDHFCQPLSIDQSNERLRQTFERGNKRARLKLEASDNDTNGRNSPTSMVNTTPTQAKRRQTGNGSQQRNGTPSTKFSETGRTPGVKCEIIEAAPLNLWTLPIGSVEMGNGMNADDQSSSFVQSLFGGDFNKNGDGRTTVDKSKGKAEKAKAMKSEQPERLVDVVGTTDSDSEGSSREGEEGEQVMHPVLKYQQQQQHRRSLDEEDSPKKRLDALFCLDTFRNRAKEEPSTPTHQPHKSLLGNSNNSKSMVNVTTAASTALQQLAALGAASENGGSSNNNNNVSPIGGLFANLFGSEHNSSPIVNGNNRKFSAPVLSGKNGSSLTTNNKSLTTTNGSNGSFGNNSPQQQRNNGNGDSLLHAIAARLRNKGSSASSAESSPSNPQQQNSSSKGKSTFNQQNKVSNQKLLQQSPQQNGNGNHTPPPPPVSSPASNINANNNSFANSSLMALMNAATNIGTNNSNGNGNNGFLSSSIMGNGGHQHQQTVDTSSNGRKHSLQAWPKRNTSAHQSGKTEQQLIGEILQKFAVNNNNIGNNRQQYQQNQQQHQNKMSTENGTKNGVHQFTNLLLEKTTAAKNQQESIAEAELICTLLLSMAKGLISESFIQQNQHFRCLNISIQDCLQGKSLAFVCAEENGTNKDNLVGTEIVQRMGNVFGMKAKTIFGVRMWNSQEIFQADYIIALDMVSVSGILGRIERLKTGVQLILRVFPELMNVENAEALKSVLDRGHVKCVSLLLYDDHRDMNQQQDILRSMVQHPHLFVFQLNNSSTENGDDKNHSTLKNNNKDRQDNPREFDDSTTARVLQHYAADESADETRQQFIASIAAISRVIASLDEASAAASNREPSKNFVLHLPRPVFMNGLNKVLVASAIVSILSARHITNGATGTASSIAEAEEAAIALGLNVHSKMTEANEIAISAGELNVAGQSTSVGTILTAINGQRLSVPVLLSPGNDLAISRRLLSTKTESAKNNNSNANAHILEQLGQAISIRSSVFACDLNESVEVLLISLENAPNNSETINDEIHNSFLVIQC